MVYLFNASIRYKTRRSYMFYLSILAPILITSLAKRYAFWVSFDDNYQILIRLADLIFNIIPLSDLFIALLTYDGLIGSKLYFCLLQVIL